MPKISVEKLTEEIQKSNSINSFFKGKYIKLLNIAYTNYVCSKDKLETTMEEIIEKEEISIQEENPKIPSVVSNAKISSINLFPLIVHGHDELTLFKLKDFLHNKLCFKEPIMLKQIPDGGHTIIEKFDHYSELIDLVFILLTTNDTLIDSTKRTRQNVILELGYFMGKLKRKSGKIIVLKKGDIELPSDLRSVIEIDISNGLEMCYQKIRDELSSVVTFMK